MLLMYLCSGRRECNNILLEASTSAFEVGLSKPKGVLDIKNFPANQSSRENIHSIANLEVSHPLTKFHHFPSYVVSKNDRRFVHRVSLQSYAKLGYLPINWIECCRVDLDEDFSWVWLVNWDVAYEERLCFAFLEKKRFGNRRNAGHLVRDLFCNHGPPMLHL